MEPNDRKRQGSFFVSLPPLRIWKYTITPRRSPSRFIRVFKNISVIIDCTATSSFSCFYTILCGIDFMDMFMVPYSRELLLNSL